MKVLSDKIIYLRKSRQDDPRETVEEVLTKHEIQLQDYAEREFGGRVPEENIFREVVSGESIDEREQIKAVLARIEDPAITGVIVTEAARLSRGDLDDCATIIKVFRYSRTLIHTRTFTFDLEQKRDRKFFQDELLRGNDYLEYIKEILWFGRVAAVKRGAFIGGGNSAPYGYKKAMKGKEHSLEPDGNADNVRMIFDWFANEGLSCGQVAKRLNERGVKTAGGHKWNRDKVLVVLKNRHYIGLVVYNQRQTVSILEDGQVTKKRRFRDTEDDDVIVAQGLHTAIIDKETWNRAQERLKTGSPKVKHTQELKYDLAGLLYCAGCGRVMRRQIYKKADTRLTCRNSPVCYKSAPESDIRDAVLYALENSELPALEQKLRNGDGESRKIQERMLAKLEKEMAELRAQEDRQYELLETNPNYSPEVFERRHAALREKMDACQEAIYRTKTNMPEHVDFEERIVALTDAIEAMKDPEMPATERNKLLKAIIDRIEYTGPAKGFKEAGWGVNRFDLEIKLKL